LELLSLPAPRFWSIGVHLLFARFKNRFSCSDKRENDANIKQTAIEVHQQHQQSFVLAYSPPHEQRAADNRGGVRGEI
jgi:hypothetical protein